MCKKYHIKTLIEDLGINNLNTTKSTHIPTDDFYEAILKPGLHIVRRIGGICLRPCLKELITALQVSVAKVSCETLLLLKTYVTM